MVEEIKDSNQAAPDSSAADQTAASIEESKAPKGELLCVGVNVKQGGLQANFDRFRRAKKDEIKYRNYMAA